MPERKRADNEALFRQINERIGELNHAFSLLTPYGSWTCECARIECIERIELTIAEYEAVRAEPTRFVVAPGDEHVNPETDLVAERDERFWIVEKRGAAAERARETDARSRPLEVSRAEEDT